MYTEVVCQTASLQLCSRLPAGRVQCNQRASLLCFYSLTVSTGWTWGFSFPGALLTCAPLKPCQKWSCIIGGAACFLADGESAVRVRGCAARGFSCVRACQNRRSGIRQASVQKCWNASSCVWVLLCLSGAACESMTALWYQLRHHY